MAIYDLDLNEEIDTIKINGVEYKVWDIPERIIEKIMNIKVWIFNNNIIEKWKPICKEILEIRNKNVDIDNITKEKMFAFIQYIKNKIQKWQLW